MSAPAASLKTNFVHGLLGLEIGLSGAPLIKFLISESLVITQDAVLAMQMIQRIREYDGGMHDNDVLASVDHFHTAFMTQSIFSYKPIGGAFSGPPALVGSFFCNQLYSGLKVFNAAPQDTPNIPVSPLTYQQYRWGNIGAVAALRFRYDLWPTSPEWKDFLSWLDAQ